MIHDLKVTAVAAPVREQVVRRLRDAILSGQFHPGDRLIERELVEWTSVSRTSIREALRQLESEGLVTVLPSRGPVVTVLTEETARQIYAVRAVLEGYAARQFAINATEEQRRRLEASVDTMAAIVDAGEPIIYEKGRFYEILFEGAGNEVAWSLFGSLYARIALLRATTLAAPGRPPRTIQELREILIAIANRDSVEAEQSTIRHVEEAARMAIQTIQTEPGYASPLVGALGEE
jgi:DNA-binding GntR family transcriptional regulator